MPVSLQEFETAVVDHQLVTPSDLRLVHEATIEPIETAEQLAEALVRHELLTAHQSETVLQGDADSLTLGNYVITDKIGAGGMGQVFKARHRRMNRVVAVKVLPARLSDERTIQRFHREVEAAARLSHTHVVTSHDADEHNGVHYMVMEFVDGEDLSALVRRTGRLPIDRAVNFSIQAATGLEYAHSRGIVHRDIKPSNLLLDGSGIVKILDMGLARFENREDEGQQLTQTGNMMGTADFMSPEQALDTREADARSDIYSLGCTLYWLLTGEPVYVGDTIIKKILAHRDQPVPSIRRLRPEIPNKLDGVIQKMIAKSPDDRFQSMTQVIEALSALNLTEISPVDRGVASPGQVRRLDATDAMTLLTDGGQRVLGTAGSLGTLEQTDVERAATDVSGEFTDTLITQEQPVGQETKPGRRKPIWLWIGSAAGLILVIGAVIAFSLNSKQDEEAVELVQQSALESPATRDSDPNQSPAAVGASNEAAATNPATAAVDALADIPNPGTGLVDPTMVLDLPDPELPSTQDVVTLPGLVADPQPVPGISRWQLETRLPRSAIQCLDWHPFESVVAFGSVDGSIRIMNVETGELEQILLHDHSPVHQVMWDLRGSRVASLNSDRQVRIWSRDGRSQAVEVAGDPIMAIDWTADGRYLTGVGQLSGWYEWGAVSGELREFHPVAQCGGTGICWSPDGKLCAISRDNGTVEIWGDRQLSDSVRKRRLHSLAGPEGMTRFPCWNHDGSTVSAFFEADQSVYSWSPTGEPQPTIATGSVQWIVWNPKEPVLASRGVGVQFWTADGETAGGFDPGRLLASGPVCWTADGSRLVCPGSTNDVIVVDRDGAVGGMIDGLEIAGDSQVRFAPSGDQLVTAEGPAARLWSLAGQPLQRLGGISSVSVSWIDDEHLLVSTNRGELLKWSRIEQKFETLRNGTGLQSDSTASGDLKIFSLPDGSLGVLRGEGSNPEVLEFTDRGVTAIRISPDGQSFATRDDAGTVGIWDQGGMAHPVVQDGTAVRDMAWHPGSQQLALLHELFILVDLAGQKRSSPLFPDLNRASCLAFSPDGQRIAIGFRQSEQGERAGTVQLFNLEGKRLSVLPGCGPNVVDLEWSAASNRLVATCADTTIRCWTMEEQTLEWVSIPLNPREALDAALTISPAGKLLHGSPNDLEQHLVYVFADSSGRLRTVRPSEFAAQTSP